MMILVEIKEFTAFQAVIMRIMEFYTAAPTAAVGTAETFPCEGRGTTSKAQLCLWWMSSPT